MPRKSVPKAKAPAKVKEPVTPKTLDELLSVIRILTAHRIYYTLANPTHSAMGLHIVQTDLVRAQELLPDLLPKINKSALWGHTITFTLSGAPDKPHI